MTTMKSLNSRDAYLMSEVPRLKTTELPPNFEIPGLKKLTLSQSAPYFTTEPLPSGQPYGPTEIVITAELTAIAGNPVFTVVTGATRLHPGPTGSSRILRIEDMTAQSAVISVSVEDTSTFKETPTAPNKIFTAETTIAIVRDGLVGADGADGAQGFHGVTVALSLDAGAFHYRADGTSPAPETSVLTAQSFNLREGLTPYYQFYKNDVLVQQGYDNTYTYTPPANSADLPEKLEVAVREDGAESRVVARDMYVVGGVVPGSDAVNIFLSNQAHAVPVTSSGVADYAGSGTTIEVYEGDVRLTPLATLGTDLGTYSVVAEGHGITVGTRTISEGKVIVEDHEALIANTATVTYSVTVNKLSGETVTFLTQQSISRAAQGQDGIVNQSRTVGINKRSVSLQSVTPVVVYTAAGDVPVPGSVGFTTSVKNFDPKKTLYYQFYVDGVSKQLGTSGTFSLTPTPYFADGANGYEVLVKVREGSTTAPVLAQDLFTVQAAKQGTQAITVALSNASHALPTDFSEVVDYLGSGTDIVAYEGGTKLSAADLGAGTFRVSVTGTNVAPGDLSKPDSYTYRLSNASDMVSDQAAVQIGVGITRLDGSSVEQLVAVQRLSKSREIVHGDSARGVNLSAGTQVIRYDEAGENPTPATITVTADAVNTVNQPKYKFYVNGTPKQLSTDPSFTLALPPRFLASPIVVEVELGEDGIGGILAKDQITITSLRESSDGISVVLSNETHTLQADHAGVVSSFAGSGTAITVWQGARQLAYDASGTSEKGTYQVSATATNLTLGAATTVGSSRIYGDITGISADSATVYFDVFVTGFDGITRKVTLQQTVTKSLGGVPGVDGPRGPGHFYATGSAWSDETANTATPGSNTKDDVVTISNGSSYAMTKIWNGTSWVAIGTVIDGNLLVAGSISAAKINSQGLSIKDSAGNVIMDANADDGVHIKNTTIDGALMKEASIKSAAIESLAAEKISATKLSAIAANLGTVTAGRIKSQNGAVDIDLSNNSFTVASGTSGARLVMQKNVIKVYDANGVLRVKLGDLSA